MSARRGRCSLSSRRTLALCLLGGMAATPVRAGPLAMLGFGAKGNNAQALAIPNAKRNIRRMNVSQYASAALEVLDMKYGNCLEKAVAGGMLAPTAQSCIEELSTSRDQVMKINLKQEVMELAGALQQQEQKAIANIKAEQISLKKNAEKEKAQINRQIESLKKKGILANAKQLAGLEARARNVEKTINKYGGAIVKGVALYAAEAAGDVAGGGVGAAGAGALRSFMKKTGLNQMATALVFAAAICAGAIGMVAIAQVSVLSIFRKIMSMIKKILLSGAMTPIRLIRKLIDTTRNYVRETTNNRNMAQIEINVIRVAIPTASARGSRAPSGNSERTITAPSSSTATSSRSGVTTRSRRTSTSSGASSLLTSPRR